VGLYINVEGRVAPTEMIVRAEKADKKWWKFAKTLQKSLKTMQAQKVIPDRKHSFYFAILKLFYIEVIVHLYVRTQLLLEKNSYLGTSYAKRLLGINMSVILGMALRM
jgi:NADH dehydrogenase/NADH:ubiquinone oxidoreductase subunit G